MSSIAFARQVKATGYGHDILFSFGTTANGEVIDFTADRILSVKTAWAQTEVKLSTEVAEKTHGLRGSDFESAAEVAGISAGVLRAERGSAQLFNPIVDHPAAALASAFDAVGKVGPESPSEDAAGKSIAIALGRPSGAHLRGGNIVNGDGTLRAALQVPRLVVVQIFAPGEQRQVTAAASSAASEKVVAAVEKASSIEGLCTAAGPLVEDLASRESLVADVLEMREDLTLMTGVLPGADNGLAVPFESTQEGFARATAFAEQMRQTIPDTVVSLARTWKRV